MQGTVFLDIAAAAHHDFTIITSYYSPGADITVITYFHLTNYHRLGMYKG
jgi:hypothetical protein